MCGRLYNQLMLMRLNSFPESLQVVAFKTLNLPGHDDLAAVNLLDDMMYHDASLIVFKFSGLEVLESSLNGVAAVIFSYNQIRQNTKP
jgi:hypothetical protein